MKTLNLSAELSCLAMNTINTPQAPQTILSSIRQFLTQRMDTVGQFVECRLIEEKNLDTRMQLKEYDLRYEKQTLRLKFMFFRPRGTWQIQGFNFV